MIYLLYGDDTYRSWQKLQSIKTKYLNASKGDTDLIILDGETLTADDLIRQIKTVPLLATTRLIIVKNLLQAGQKAVTDAVAERLETMPQSTVLFFYEAGVPDQRTKLFKRLNQPKQAQLFERLADHQLHRYIVDKVEQEGLTIDRPAVQALVLMIGADLWRLDNELEKLILSAQSVKKGQSKSIQLQDVQQLVKDESQPSLFQLTDAFGNRQSSVALKALKQTTEPEPILLATLANHYRNLIAAKEATRQRMTKEDLVKALQLHPFAVEKAMQQSRHYEWDELLTVYRFLFQLDLLSKQSMMEVGTGLAVLAAAISQRPLELPDLRSLNPIDY